MFLGKEYWQNNAVCRGFPDEEIAALACNN